MTVEQLIFLLIDKPRQAAVYVRTPDAVVVEIGGLGQLLEGGENYSACFWSVTIDTQRQQGEG